MLANPYGSHLAEEVTGANPLELVVLLYRGALDAVRSARRLLAADDKPGRAHAISRAMEILGELSHSLDTAQGGEVGARLAELYAYMLSRLAAANAEQTAAPLAEVEQLLATLLEAWQQLARPQIEDTAAAPVYGSAASEAGSLSFAC